MKNGIVSLGKMTLIFFKHRCKCPHESACTGSSVHEAQQIAIQPHPPESASVYTAPIKIRPLIRSEDFMEKNFHLSDQNFVLVQIESDLRYRPRKIGREKRDNSRPPHWFDAIAINALTFLYVIHMKCFDIIKKNTEAYWDHINTYKPFFLYLNTPFCEFYTFSVNFTLLLKNSHYFCT